jgi:hypothetical protein
LELKSLTSGETPICTIGRAIDKENCGEGTGCLGADVDARKGFMMGKSKESKENCFVWLSLSLFG